MIGTLALIMIFPFSGVYFIEVSGAEKINETSRTFDFGSVILLIQGIYEGTHYRLEVAADYGDLQNDEDEGSEHAEATLTIAEYGSNPRDVDPELARNANYMDIQFSSNSSPERIIVAADCPCGDCYANVLRWFDGEKWKDVQPQAKEEGYIEAVLTENSSSSPSISDLSGTPFVIGSRAPTASFDYTPPDPDTADEISFDASGSSDPNDSIVAYRWDWTDDGIYDDSTTQATIDHSYEDKGTYSVTLKVTDNAGASDTITKKVTVTEVGPPQANPGGPYNGMVGKPLQLVGYATGGVPPYSYEWNLDEDRRYDDSTKKEPTCIWKQPGEYGVGLRVTDSRGAKSTCSTTVRITPADHFFPARWSLASIPLVPPDSSPGIVFGDDLSNFYLYKYETSQRRYLFYPRHRLNLDPGKGYWLYLEEGRTVDVGGKSPADPYKIELKRPGWHLIGTPYPIRWGQVEVNGVPVEEDTGQSFAGPMKGYIYSYDGMENYSIARPPHWTGFWLNSWEGYWVRTTEPSVELSFSGNDPIVLSSEELVARLTGGNNDRNQALTTAASAVGGLPSPPLPSSGLTAKGFSVQTTVFPNPLIESRPVTVKTTGGRLMGELVTGLKVTVFNSDGTRIYSKETENEKLVWDPETLGNGVYLLKTEVRVNNTWVKEAVKKFMVLR